MVKDVPTLTRPRRLVVSKFRRLGVWTVAGLFAAGVVSVAAATWRPSWYRPAAADHSRLLEDKKSLADLESRISAALNAGQAVRIEVSQDEANRWLAARREMWVESPLDTAGLQHPYLRFMSGAVEAAALLTPALAEADVIRPRAVATARVAARSGAEDVEIVLQRLSVGALPVPVGLLEKRLRAVTRYDWGELGAEPRGGLRLRNGFTWPNGRRRFRVRDIAFGVSRLSIELEPLRYPAGHRDDGAAGVEPPGNGFGAVRQGK